MEFALLFGILPLVSIGLLFIKDANKKRRIILNILLILNAIVFTLPMLAAYLSTAEGESMFNENTGGGAYLWFYMFLLPLCGFVLFVLLILKIVFAYVPKK
ncbi:hypothetical protein [Croceivirga thetidis]|uniref:Uncharacterized protein n=1 Tax=Croceivirga thetidis TaxID=2721623 RepID=A0ABX1GTJ0_9FLAO|nr:hypothetical protein [Croceivirga thetidis]NKI33279.1 hypothetical protein [Croceivirga thetidis]